ncbi:MAG: 50S ribosomal protein L13 [Candidatus Tectomicrobia bacterium]|nr:50S ribosomal protein L13 [Candidatus Tectomicrobia bacterium]
MKTFSATRKEGESRWYLVDAEGKVLGRLASQIAAILRGKHTPLFTPYIDTGDHVIVINIDKIVLTGKKLEKKTYYRHSGYPGGLRSITAKKLLQTKPAMLMELAVKRMLPKNRLGRAMFRKLRVYSAAEHPHAAQKPELLNLGG